MFPNNIDRRRRPAGARMNALRAREFVAKAEAF
jgi:hypothetical protein